jgi:hypothetical protein
MSVLTYYPLDDSKPVVHVAGIPGQGWRTLVNRLAEDEADEDNYSVIELFGPDEDYVEAVTYKGEVIGTLDDQPRYDISEYETFDQMELREAREEAERDAQAEYALEDRLEARRAAE